MASPSVVEGLSEPQGAVATATSGARKPSPQAAQSARPITPRGLAAQQPSQTSQTSAVAEGPVAPAPHPTGASGTSCDPPFYIDADGTKRYKRYCANL